MVEEESGIEVVEEIDPEFDSIFDDGKEFFYFSNLLILPPLLALNAIAPEDGVGGGGEEGAEELFDLLDELGRGVGVEARAREVVDAETVGVEVDGEGVVVDVTVVDAEAVGVGAFCPFADVAIVFADAVFKGAAFVFAVGDCR